MNIWQDLLWVGAGGLLGTAGRYLMGQLPLRAQSGFPVVTLAINLIGAFAIGIIVALSEKSGNRSPQLLLFLKTGLCGGFTTFSTFSLEAMQLLQNGKWGAALAYMGLSVVLCVAAVFGAQAVVNGG